MAWDTIEKEYPLMYFTSVNRRVNPYLMKNEELWDCVNFWTEGSLGEKKVRPGLTPFLDQIDTDPVKALHFIKFPNGKTRLARVSGTKIYLVDPLANPATWGSAKITINANFNRPEFAILSAIVSISDRLSISDHRYLEWTDAAGTDSIVDPNYVSSTNPVVRYKAKSIVAYHRRIYGVNTFDVGGEATSDLSWSSIDYQNKGTTPSTPWTTQSTLTDTTYASFTPVDSDNNGDCLKVTNIADSLQIYKESGMYRFNDVTPALTDAFGFGALDGSVATIPEVKQDIFLTNEGFFKNDGTNVTIIGDGWYPIIKQIFRNGFTPSKVCSIGANFLYFCYMGDIKYDDKTVNNACFVYNSFYDELNLFSFAFDVTSFGTYINASKDKVILVGDSGGRVYTFDYSANDDAGQPIQAMLRHKYYFFDAPQRTDNMTEIKGYSTLASEVQVLADKDFHNEYQEIASIKGTDIKKRMGYDKIGQFKTLSFKIMWNGKGVRPGYYGLIPKIKQQSERKK